VERLVGLVEDFDLHVERVGLDLLFSDGRDGYAADKVVDDVGVF